jgi:hypothetical protein
MKRSRFSEEQIIGILREQERGARRSHFRPLSAFGRRASDTSSPPYFDFHL